MPAPSGQQCSSPQSRQSPSNPKPSKLCWPCTACVANWSNSAPRRSTDCVAYWPSTAKSCPKVAQASPRVLSRRWPSWWIDCQPCYLIPCVSNGRGSGSSTAKSQRSNAVCAPGTKRTRPAVALLRFPVWACSQPPQPEPRWATPRASSQAVSLPPGWAWCPSTPAPAGASACWASANTAAPTPGPFLFTGRIRMLGISKRGDTYLRTLLIHGARSVIANSKQPTEWVTNLTQRRPANVAVVALANKMARTIWALLAHEREFQKGYVSQPV